MISLKHLLNCADILQPLQDINLNQQLNFITDSRKYNHPAAFVAIPGAKVNPLNLITPILDQGCPLVIYQKNLENDELIQKLSLRFPTSKFLPVSDSVTFLQQLTNSHIQEWKTADPHHTVFAISGSNGKTTHKEMLSHILKTIRPNKIVATEKNNNNHLGVPLTLLNVHEQTEMVVLELGSNHPGEIKVLCDIAVPNAGLTTNIGATHLEFFGTEEKVFTEEGYLYYAVKNQLKDKGFYLINLDDPFLSTLPLFPGAITYGENPKAMARVTFLENGAEINYKGESLRVINDSITGRHNKLNLVTCAFIAHQFYPSEKDSIIQAALKFRPTKNRSEWIEFEKTPVYLDAYNANPSSMKAALEGFKNAVLEKNMSLDEACVVLGDMNELGESTQRYHQEIGQFVQALGFKNAFFIGRFSSFYLQGHSEGQGRASAALFKQEYRTEMLKKFRIHFIKGSRSLQLESLFDIS
jgi:UDP-N-acetylmuramoyl-tripeptide--D-alanyl-D-alanine ligase